MDLIDHFLQIFDAVLGVDLEEDSNLNWCSEAALTAIAREFNNPSAWKEKINSCKSYEDRVNFLKQFYQWIPMKPEVFKKYQKDSSMSRSSRNKANEMCSTENYTAALRSSTFALMFAEPESEDLGMAFADRSAVLMGLGDPKGALVDIQRAMDNNYPESLRCKLRDLKLKCEKMVQDQAYQANRSEEEDENNRELQIEKSLRKKILDAVSEVKNLNPLMPAAADFVEIQWSDKMGRMLVVNRDVQAGSVILVEDPFVSALDKEAMRWSVVHCHHCLKQVNCGIPCKKCVFAVYCDETCRSKADEGPHKYECQSGVYLHCNEAIETKMLLAFRIIGKVGPEELYKIFSSKDPKYFNQAQSFGTEANSNYSSDSYLPVFHLETYSDKIQDQERYHNTLCALFLTSVLDHQSNFFEAIPKDNLESFKSFIASLILRHIESTSMNAQAVLQYTPHPLDPRDKEVLGFGWALYPAYSLLNHSCDPNVFRLNTNTGAIIVISTRSLKKGEPILISYCGLQFSEQPLKQRRDHLLEKYYFRCDCIACRNDWPTFEHLEKRFLYTCPGCSRKLYQHEKESPNYPKFVLTGPPCCERCGETNNTSIHECIGCGTKYQYREVSSRLDVNCKLAEKAMDLFRDGYPGRTVDLITKLFDYFQFYICPNPPNVYQAMIQMLYKKAILEIVHPSRRFTKIAKEFNDSNDK